jgi:NAD(P)-dependent dehydrogenase (short-subunit alcohol dehydrogenase family)
VSDVFFRSLLETPMQPLIGRIAIVTGAGGGIGRAVSLMLAQSGARVVLAARNQARLEKVGDEILSAGGEALAVPTDVTREEGLKTLVDRTLQAYGSIDYLINNAGWGKKSPVVKSQISDWDQTLSVNLRAPMILSKLVLPTLIDKRSGAIINIGSISGKQGSANVAAYAASKFGLVGFTESLFEEVREHGIKVSVIHPGFVDTPLIPPNPQLNRSKMIRPDDVAHAVLYVLKSSPACCPVEIIIRPQKTPFVQRG